MTERFHKAAQDGFLDVLKEATRRDCNSKDEDGMTPTLWGAFEGNLDALRLLVGRGGEPDKCDNYGNTALHLAAAKGHLNCVTFLVNFGVNIYDLDIDNHTAKDLAAINGKEDILKFLDSAAAVQEGNNPKQVKALQEKAKKDAEKRIKNFQKITKKAEKIANKEDEKLSKERRRMSLFPEESVKSGPNLSERRPSLGAALLGTVGRRDSKVIGQQVGTLSYSAMVGGGGTVNSRKLKSGVFKKLASKPTSSGEFTVRDKENGKRTALTGLRRDSEIIFMNQEVSDRMESLESEENEPNTGYISEPSSIFNRPGWGSMAFRKSITAFNHLNINDEDRKEDSIGSAGSLANRNDQNNRIEEEEWDGSDISDDEDDLGQGVGPEFASVQMFLAATGLTAWIPTFLKERIDLDSLMLLSESDLASELRMPLGPRKKLMKAISERQEAIDDPDVISDSRL